MNETIKLARCMGFPLINNGEPVELIASEALTDLAFANGVELIYLMNLQKANKLGSLEGRLEEYETRRKKSAECVVRIARAMDDQHIPYAITKTLRPYPATPNDTDLLYLGPLNDYVNALRRFESTGFVMCDGIKMQTEFFDPKGGGVFQQDKSGGQFYIDFYSQLAADHMPYMDSKRLTDRVVTQKVNDYEVKVFEPIAEMTILYLHSVVMHRTFPLEVFWSTAYWLKDMNDQDLDNFAEFVRSHHAVVSTRIAFTLMAELCQQAYGEVPDKIQGMLNRIGEQRSEREEFKARMYATPHISLFSTWVFAVLEKNMEWHSMKGFLKELAMMINPIFFIEVLHHMFSRKRIKKHSKHV